MRALFPSGVLRQNDGNGQGSSYIEGSSKRHSFGHSYFTHYFILQNEEVPICVSCQQNFTIKHILLECTDFQQVRARFYDVKTLKDLFINKLKLYQIIYLTFKTY